RVCRGAKRVLSVTRHNPERLAALLSGPRRAPPQQVTDGIVDDDRRSRGQRANQLRKIPAGELLMAVWKIRGVDWRRRSVRPPQKPPQSGGTPRPATRP